VNRLVRACGVVVAAVAAVSCTGCMKSENEGKLEGTKWSSAYIPDFKGISGRGATASIQFTDGGRFAMEFRVPQGALRFSGTWRLGPGSIVYLDDVAPTMDGMSSFMEYITVTDDVMIMEDPDGTKIFFTRIDEAMEKAAKTPTTPTGPKKTTLADGTVETTERNGKGVKKTYGQ
jgi:hypothetical protein